MFRLNFFLVSSLVLASAVSARIIDADSVNDVVNEIVNDIDTVTLGVIEGEPQEDVVVQVQDAPAEADPTEVDPAADRLLLG